MSAGARHIRHVVDDIFSQLSDFSLEELGLDRPESVSWKDVDGLHFQMLGYSMLGIFDLCISHYVMRLKDPQAREDALRCMQHVMGSYARLSEWLSAASRTKLLKGMILVTAASRCRHPATAGLKRPVLRKHMSRVCN